MPEENAAVLVDSGDGQQQTEPAAQVESQPAGGSRTYTREEMDARIKARIDKQNAKHAEETDALHGEIAEKDAELEQAQARLAALEHERELREWAEQASAESGVPASVIRATALRKCRRTPRSSRPPCRLIRYCLETAANRERLKSPEMTSTRSGT